MQLRPARVPKVARYSTNDGWWQVGEIVDGRPFGPWRTFRADGSPLFEARFDKKGRLQGTFKRFHPDGSLARKGGYAHGVPKGDHVYRRAMGAPGDLFPTSDPRAWQVVMRYDKSGKPKSRILLDERGNELGAAADDTAGELDTLFANAKPDGYLASGVLPLVLGALGNAPDRARDDFLLPIENAPARRALTPARYQELYGRAVPAPLRAWFDAFATGSPRLCGMRLVRDNDLAGDGNLIETLIVEHQAAPGRASALRELATGVLSIGDAGGLRYVLSLCEVATDQPSDAVWLYDPASSDLTGPVARTLDDFAYAVALTGAAERNGVSLGALRTAYERLRGRVDLISPMVAIEERALGEDEDTEVVGDEQKDHREGFHFRRATRVPTYYNARNRWLLQLLRGLPEAAAATFDPRYDGGLDDARFERICKHSPREPWVAFYWLFRSWVFDDPRLEQLLRICGDTPARLVRDLAALVRELADGRKRLGEVADMVDVKARFRALDPLNKKPDAAHSEESEEEEAAEADADDAQPAVTDREPGFTPGEQRRRMAARFDRSSVPAALAPAVAVIDWARNEGYTRDNLLMRDEVDAAALGLALRADPAIVRYLVELCDESPWLGEKFIKPWLDGERLPLAELVPPARRWIAAGETAQGCAIEPRRPSAALLAGSESRLAIAARILARAGTADDARAIGTVIERVFDSLFHHEQGFEAAMGRMQVREALHPMCDAVARLGVPGELVPALEALVSADTHYVDEGRGPAALALAAAGRGLDKVLEGVRGQVAKDYGHNITPGQMLALGTLGRDHRTQEVVALITDIPRLEHLTKTCQRLALYDLAGSGDIAAILRDGLADQRYSDSDTAKQREFLLDIIARRADAPAELAAPYVHDREIGVHRAAVRALRAKGAAVPEFTLYDPLHIATLSRDQIHAGLADERGLYRGNLALWICEHPDESSRAPLEGWVRRIAASGNFPDDGPPYYELRWILRALVAIGGSEPLFDELLQHDDRNIAATALRFVDQLGPAVACGVAHVFANDQQWKQSTAKAWLARHRKDPAIPEALALLGLAVEDVSSEEPDGDEEDRE